MHSPDPPWPEMDDGTLDRYQADMRYGYLCGAPGVLVSGLTWLLAGVVALTVSAPAAILTLLVAGAAIHPLSVLVAKALGRPGGHTPDNPLAWLAGETTVLLIVGLVVAYAVSTLRVEWFFPTALLIIGGRYLTFQTLYGVRTYWACGGALCVGGLALGYVSAPAYISAFVGAATELGSALALFVLARRESAL